MRPAGAVILPLGSRRTTSHLDCKSWKLCQCSAMPTSLPAAAIASIAFCISFSWRPTRSTSSAHKKIARSPDANELSAYSSNFFSAFSMITLMTMTKRNGDKWRPWEMSDSWFCFGDLRGPSPRAIFGRRARNASSCSPSWAPLGALLGALEAFLGPSWTISTKEGGHQLALSLWSNKSCRRRGRGVLRRNV